MNTQHSYRIIGKNNGQAVILIDLEILELLEKHCLCQDVELPQKSVTDTKAHNFQRRIVPFFMNQFMHWAEQMQYHQVDGYLKSIHKKKTSKQQKFELGDLKKLFGYLNPRTKHIQSETQKKWVEFLAHPAEVSVHLNNKIKDKSTKGMYINAIASLKDELKKDHPYYNFLSLPKKESTITSYDIDSEFQGLDQFSSENQMMPTVNEIEEILSHEEPPSTDHFFQEQY